MGQAIVHLIARPVIPRGSADSDALQRRRLEGLVHRLDGLACPDVLPFGVAPANGDNRGAILCIMNGGVDRVHPALLGEGSEVDDDLRPWRERACDLDVEQHLAVAILILPWLVGCASYADRCDLGNWEVDLLKVGL